MKFSALLGVLGGLNLYLIRAIWSNLCYLWLAKAILRNDFYISDYGNVAFDLDSQSNLNRASNRDRKYIKDQFLEAATAYRNDIVQFLNEKSSTYTLWYGKKKANRTRFAFKHI